MLRLPRNVTLQRTQSRSNATRMLQSPATKCHTGAAPATQRQSPATTCHTAAAPATQRHTATYHSLHQPPRATLQHYQDASITCHQMSHCCCACHAPSHCNVPFPAPATQSHAPTLPDHASITCHQMSHWCCASHATSHCNVPRAAPTLPGCFNHLPLNVTLVLRLPRNVNHLPPHVTLVLRLPRNVTLQRTIPCTSHPEPRCNWKCHVYKRSNFTCTSEPMSCAQANPRPSCPDLMQQSFLWNLFGCSQFLTEN